MSFNPFLLVWNDKFALADTDYSYITGWRRLCWRLWIRE